MMLLMHLLALATIATSLQSAAPVPTAAAEAPAPPFSIPRRDTPIDQPLVATVSLDDSADDALHLVLVDHAGNVLGETGPVAEGEIQLCEALPAIDSLERAAWVQAVVGGEPSGSAWVIVPMRDRPKLRTATATRPDGVTPYTRIVGWGDRIVEPSNDEIRESAKSWEPSEVPLGGFRCYPERDVVLETDRGAIVVALRPDEAPNTAWNFRDLAAAGFYDGTIVHRVVPLDREGRPFVIQGGDPTGEGEGGPGYSIPFEPTSLPHDFGVISMARDDDPDSAGSQWFIGLSRAGTARLDGQYAAFGEVVEGAATIVELANVVIADPARGRPETPPVVHRAFLRPAPPRTPGEGRPDRRVAPVSVVPIVPATPADPGR
ncbi:MAG: peptidylprolyl isomerase [Phycisphaerales bacterium]